MIDSGCLLLAAERSRSGRAFLFISFLLFSSLSSPQPTKGALGLHRFCMFLLFISFVAKRNETKKGCRGLTCRLRREGSASRDVCSRIEVLRFTRVVVASSASNRTHDGDGVTKSRCLRRVVAALWLGCMPLVALRL